LQDDYLDVYGDSAVFGKKIGGDILCGKKTFLLINALQRADQSTGEHLLSLLSDATLVPTKKIEAVTALYNQLGIAQLTLDRIESFYTEAYHELQQLSLPAAQWKPLWDYAQSLLGRKK